MDRWTTNASSTHATQSMSSFFPLQLMFTPNGLLTNPNHINYNWYASSINMFEQQEQFKHHYNVTPYQFAKTEIGDVLQTMLFTRHLNRRTLPMQHKRET